MLENWVGGLWLDAARGGVAGGRVQGGGGGGVDQDSRVGRGGGGVGVVGDPLGSRTGMGEGCC